MKLTFAMRINSVCTLCSEGVPLELPFVLYAFGIGEGQGMCLVQPQGETSSKSFNPCCVALSGRVFT